MRLTKKAQSVIEYTLVIVLVLAGALFMRPYVIRGVNAHMKGWEDNVHDSLHDPLKKGEIPASAAPVCPDGSCAGDPFETEDSCCWDCGRCGDTNCCPGSENNNINNPGDPAFCNYDCGGCPDGFCGDTKNGPEDFGNVGNPNGSCCQDCSACGDGYCCLEGGIAKSSAEIITMISNGETIPPIAANSRDLNDCANPAQQLFDCPQLAVCPNGICEDPAENRTNCPQ